MGRTLEWHIRVPQQSLLNLLCLYWTERNCSVTIEDGPQDGLSRRSVDLQADALALVLATDPSGWTIVVQANTSIWDEDLWKWLTFEAQASLLAGFYFSIVGMSHWAWFERGQLQAEHWDFGTGKTSCFQLDPARRPTGADSLGSAFEAFDQIFHDAVFSRVQLDLHGSKQVLVQCHPARERHKYP